MGGRKRLLTLILILAFVSLSIATITLQVLYTTALEETRARLVNIAQSRARLIESIAHYDVEFASMMADGIPDYDPLKVTMGHLTEAHNNFEGFGKTGEYTLAKRVDDKIDFLLRHRHADVAHPENIPFDSELAEPMRLALLGNSGTIVGLDYRGITVLAAYEPVAVLNLGIVVKMDLSEVRAPFIRASVIALSASVFLVLLGAVLFFRVTNPMIAQIVRSEERYRQFFEATQATKLLIDPSNGMIIEANEAALNYYGYDRETITSMKISDINTLSEEEVSKEMQQALDRKQPYFMFEHRLASGEIRDVEVYSSPIEIAGKTLLFSIIHDVTARRLAEAARKRTQKFTQTVIDGFPEYLMVINRDYTIALANRKVHELAGGEDPVAERLTCHQVSHGCELPCESEQHPCPLKEVLETRAHVTVEHMHHNAEGYEVPVEVIMAPIFGEDGEVIQFIESVRDITERKQAEADYQAKHRLEATATLAGGLSHDINNLMAGVLGYADLLLLDVKPDDAAYESLTAIADGATKAADLAKQLLAFSRQGKYTTRKLDFSELLSDAITSFKNFIPDQVEVRVEAEKDLPEIIADPVQMHQILFNLVSNSLEAIVSEGTITVSVKGETVTEPDEATDPEIVAGNYLHISIKDDGRGMSAEVLSKAFEPFYTTNFMGRGLGLSAVYGIIKNHNGYVSLQSEEGVGTVVNIWFPQLIDE